MVIENLRVSLKKSTREELFNKLDRELKYDPWGSFRNFIQQIYRVQTGLAAKVTADLAQTKREKNRNQKNGPVGRKTAQGIIVLL